jgi:hypothetical protein
MLLRETTLQSHVFLIADSTEKQACCRSQMKAVTIFGGASARIRARRPARTRGLPASPPRAMRMRIEHPTIKARQMLARQRHQRWQPGDEA